MADTNFPDEWLVHSLEGVLTPERLVELRAKAVPQATLWETLVAQRVASDDQILSALSTRFRLKLADLANMDPAAREKVPEQVARRYRILPLQATDSYLEVATANPFDLDAEKALAFATAREIRMRLLAPSKIAEKLDELYRPEKALDKLLSGMESSAELVQLQEQLAPDEIAASEAEASQRPVVRLVDLIISEGILARSSDIHIEPEEGGVAVRYRIDGVLRQVMKIPRQAGLPLISRIKIMSSLDPAGVAGREGRDPHPRLAGHRQVARIAGLESRRDRGDQASAGEPRGHPARDRSDRLRQDHDAVLLHQPDQERRREHRHRRGPGRVPHARDRTGASPGEDGTDVRLGAALDPPAGSERRADRRDPRPGNGPDRGAGVPHRASRALDAAHQRCGQRGDAPGRHRGRSLQDRRGAARGGRAAVDAEALPHLQRSVDGDPARSHQAVGPHGDAAISSSGLPRLRHDGISRAVLDSGGPHGEPRGRAAHRGG